MDSEIPAGRDWTKEVERALDRSDAVVVLVSRGSARSFWVRAEVLRAQRKGKRVVPVIIEPGADLPLPLEPLQWVSPADAVQAVGCR